LETGRFFENRKILFSGWKKQDNRKKHNRKILLLATGMENRKTGERNLWT
jgi:hypothetical protein